MMKRLLLPALWFLVGCAVELLGQSAQLRVTIVRNDYVVDGLLSVALEAKTTDLEPAITVGSATIDLNYQSAKLEPIGYSEGVPDAASGYGVAISDLTDDGGTYLRLSLTSANIGVGFGKSSGQDIGSTYQRLVTYEFKILPDAITSNVSLTIREGSLSLGFYDSKSNENGTSVILEALIDEIDDLSAIGLPAEDAVIPGPFGLDGIYPNPTAGLVKLAVHAARQVPAIASVSDAMGRHVAKWTMTIPAGENILPVSLEGLAPGRYLLTLTTPAGRASRLISLVK